MGAWEKVIEFVLAYEGGLTDDPTDPGGLTNFGISQRAYPDLDIRALTVNDAKKIYKRDYWDACRCGEMPEPFAICLFDAAVNMGVRKAIKILQVALRLHPDGIIGPKTMDAVNLAGDYGLMRFLARRIVEYFDIIQQNPSLKVYAMNWNYRVIKLQRLAMG